MRKIASFIIPVYNGEKYLQACIDGILDQTVAHEKIEAVFVDDGSKDASLKMLRNYQKKYPDLIKVYTQENAGAGEARNNAIENAKGGYIIPIDCDDIIDHDYAQVLIDAIEESQSDYAISGYHMVDQDHKIISTVLPDDNNFTKYRLTLTCGKIYRKSFIENHRIKYIKAFIMEDPHFNVNCAMSANSVGVVRYAGYKVVVRPKVKGQLTSSTMIRDNNPYILDMIKGFVTDQTDFAQKEPVIFKYILTKFAYNNFLANKLDYPHASSGLHSQLEFIRNAGYELRISDVLFRIKGEAIATKMIIATLMVVTKLQLLKVFYVPYTRIAG